MLHSKNFFSLEGVKIVSANEMTKIEQMAISEGASELHFVETVGKEIAAAIEMFFKTYQRPKVVTLLVGKGNNGADTFAAGVELKNRGVTVLAWQIYPLEECSSLCKLMHERFLSEGGSVHISWDQKTFQFEPQGIILDGLVGTGFHGGAEGMLALAIQSANNAGLPIFAVDIPSGLNANTGVVETVAIRAAQTFFLELPKIGFFLKNGWDHVGVLQGLSFGLSERYIQLAKPASYLFNKQQVAHFFPSIKRTRHKYEAGYVLAIAGSLGMSGAAILSSFAALKSGAGIVRLFHSPDIKQELCRAPYELICEEWEGDLERIEQETIRATVLLIGPGMGRDLSSEKLCLDLLSRLHLPTVIDADALFHLSKYSEYQLPIESILTPHHQEMTRLLENFSISNKENLNYLELCQAFVDQKRVTLVLKGAPTFIFCPSTIPICVTQGDPGMATAGTGDVLTGMIAALLSQQLSTKTAAVLGVYLHAFAGEIAAKAFTSYCMTAFDLLNCIPQAFKENLKIHPAN